jgi:hypothetical protein
MRSTRVAKALSDSASASLISLRRLIRSSSFACLETAVDVTASFNQNACGSLTLAVSRESCFTVTPVFQ